MGTGFLMIRIWKIYYFLLDAEVYSNTISWKHFDIVECNLKIEYYLSVSSMKNRVYGILRWLAGIIDATLFFLNVHFIC